MYKKIVSCAVIGLAPEEFIIAIPGKSKIFSIDFENNQKNIQNLKKGFLIQMVTNNENLVFDEFIKNKISFCMFTRQVSLSTNYKIN